MDIWHEVARVHTSPWAVWGRCRGGTRPRVERDLPPPRRPRTTILQPARMSTGHDPGKTSWAPPTWAGLRLGPTTARGRGGRTNIAVLTWAPTLILGFRALSWKAPSSFYTRRNSEKPRPILPTPFPPRPPPVSLGAVPCRWSRGGGALPSRSAGGVSHSLCPRPLERFCGWDDAGLGSRNFSPPNRGCNLCLGAAGATGEWALGEGAEARRWRRCGCGWSGGREEQRGPGTIFPGGLWSTLRVCGCRLDWWTLSGDDSVQAGTRRPFREILIYVQAW